MARARGSQPPSPALAYSVIRGLVTNRLMVSPRATLSRITDLKVQPISGYRGWLVRRRRAYIFTQPKNRADLMKNVRPLLKKDFVKIIASWPIVRWTVPRLLIFYVWVLPFLTMCRHFRVADLFLVAPLQRTFAQQLPRRCASGLLTSQVRRRRWKRGLLVSEPI